MPSVQHKRGTRAALVALAAGNGLLPGQIYLITDEARLAVALTVSTFQAFLKEGEGGGGSDPWTLVKLASDFPTSATANAATGLAFGSLQANKHYVFEGMLFLRSVALTTGPRPGIIWPTGLLQNSALMLAPVSATAFVSRLWGAPSTQNAASTGVGVINESFHGTFEGQFVTGASPGGSLSISLASEIAASEVRMMANSWLRYRVLE